MNASSREGPDVQGEIRFVVLRVSTGTLREVSLLTLILRGRSGIWHEWVYRYRMLETL